MEEEDVKFQLPSLSSPLVEIVAGWRERGRKQSTLNEFDLGTKFNGTSFWTIQYYIFHIFPRALPILARIEILTSLN